MLPRLFFKHFQDTSFVADTRSIAFHKAIGFSMIPADSDQQSNVHKDYDGPGGDRVLFVREL